jgi:hypothetical protein
MDYNYLIVIFKNNIKSKLINKFITEDKAVNYFKGLKKKMESVIFPVEFKNGKSVKLELALLTNKPTKNNLFLKDDIGRQIKINLSDENFTIKEILKYKEEEKFLEVRKNKKLDSLEFLEKFLNKTGIKMLSKLNNKVILQNDDKVDLFTFKNIKESERFLDCLQNYLFENNKKDCIIVKDVSITQRKYLYEILVNKGFNKKYLFRQSTTHPS